MGEFIPDPMRADKDDRHVAAEIKKSKKSSTSFISSLNINSLRNKKVILALAIFIILLLISFFVFRSSSTVDNDAVNVTPEPNAPTTQSEPDNTQPAPTYQSIAPPPISRQTTQTQVRTGNGNHLERLEIPGEITDQLAQKIIDINKNENNARLQMNSQATETNDKYNEQPLNSTLASTHYTIQLSGSSSLESLLNYAKKYKLTNYQIYETHKNNTSWFVLIKGNYPTVNDAKEALNSLPDALKTNSPWVRSGLSVQKEKQ